MLIAQTSMLTGEINVLDLPVTEAQLALYEHGGVRLQEAFPELPPAERTFLRTGITSAEWIAFCATEPAAA